MVVNHPKSAKAEGRLTAKPTGGAGTKVALSDPVVLSGNAIAQRIKATLGITGLSLPRVHIDGCLLYTSLRTVIVTAAVYWGLNSKLRVTANLSS